MSSLIHVALHEIIANQRARIDKIEAYQAQHSEAFAPIIAFAHEKGYQMEPNDWCLQVRFSGDSHELTAFVRLLRTNGFKSDDSPPKKGASFWSPSFYRQAADDQSAHLWLSFSSTVCRRVKVGTKMVEQEVFETVCDEIVLDRAAEERAGAAP